uniref:bifunctional diaminohydroxyphosphoribosylaminopyrimidine deaminase/5-amino-6-(5-phosphoribosylamino)uracil reductase RibD n=1 Tax=Epibacterium ulvae TaxID=1156985 RepID=UPI0024923F14
MHVSEFAREAVKMAENGRGRTGTNPSVGCVIVKDGQIVGRGCTAEGGRPHAEAVALAQAGDDARGADVYVTLEPCSHAGRGPSCASGLISAGVERVFIGVVDPDTRVNGNGIALLKDAGIEVITGQFTELAEQSLASFLTRKRLGRPYVTTKLAMTLDGKIATELNESQWITNPSAREFVHHVRAYCDGVMVGASTARADDAKLIVRGLIDAVQPTRIVLTTDMRISEDSALVRTLDVAPALFVHSERVADSTITRWEALGVICRAVPETKVGLDVSAVLQVLGQLGLNQVLCEGGAALAASLLRAGLIDQLMTIYAGKLFGSGGVSGVGNLNVGAIVDAPEFRLHETKSLEGDLFADWRR